MNPGVTMILFRRANGFTRLVNNRLVSMETNHSSWFSRVVHYGKEPVQSPSEGTATSSSPVGESTFHLSPLLGKLGTRTDEYKIELVDDEAWRVTTGLVEAWRSTSPAVEEKVFDSRMLCREEPDFDEIEDMRIRGNLFYKLDRGSKEFEEYNVEFHRRKSSKGKGDRSESKSKGNLNSSSSSRLESLAKKRDEIKEQKRENQNSSSRLGGESRSKTDKNQEIEVASVRKRLRTPTFNQLTAPYHEPFCLDIYISKASARACIVHRATSKVVVVAHSISKDMKFDLGSTKNVAACAAVGEVLAQRALADDIHNVVYTPRKGEKLEGKLQIVLQSVIRNGVNVKVKIKQRKFKKASFMRAA